MLHIRSLGLRPYQEVWDAMRQYTATRDATSLDEIWLVQHPPVFTQGQAGKAEHLLAPGDIPVIQIDRGGQITYHGPGQTVMYLLLDLRRADIGIRELVHLIEEVVIGFLQEQGVTANSRADAPGVYVDGKKIASLGLRIKRGAVYHGLALNVNMDLAPFRQINPCGYAGLEMTQIADYVSPAPSLAEVSDKLTKYLQKELA